MVTFANTAYQGTVFILVSLFMTSCATPQPPSPSTPSVLAIANANSLRLINTQTQQVLQTITRYQEVSDLAYRPDGDRLAVSVCFGNQVVELETTNYNEIASPFQASSCPWDVVYSPDNLSLAAALPLRPTPTDALFGYLQVAGPIPLDRDLGRPLPAMAYRPGGQEIAVATPQGLNILGTGAAYPTLHTFPNILAMSLAYTIDGAYLIVGTSPGFLILHAADQYTQRASDMNGAVIDVAVNPSGSWLAFLRQTALSIRRAPDFIEVLPMPISGTFKDADFSSDGGTLAVAEPTGSVRLFETSTWTELTPISLTGRIDAVAYQPTGSERLPVLFIHGCCGGAGINWFESGGGTSVATALAANPSLPIDAFYLELPVHGGINPPTAVLQRSLEDDALDILAAIEGGVDSHGAMHVGILNMPAYQSRNRVAIVAYSQGTISSRYYLKNLMGDRRNGAITVSEFVTLASPNHGVGSLAVCRDLAEDDRITRQLCGGLTATLVSVPAPCGNCPGPTFGGPVPFTHNVPDAPNAPGDQEFLTELNGHPLADSCGIPANYPSEAPQSLPTTPGGVLFANLYASGNSDLLVGGHTQTGDCAGRRLARNLAPDSSNIEISGTPIPIHATFPHYWPTLCVALRTVVDHQVPADPTQACQNLTTPP